jgi:hypothetical protein
MQPYRRSYLKMTVASLTLAAISLAVAAYWLATGEIRVPVMGWVLAHRRAFHWTSVGALVAIGVACAMTGAGGLLALHGDRAHGGAGTRRRRNERG